MSGVAPGRRAQLASNRGKNFSTHGPAFVA